MGEEQLCFQVKHPDANCFTLTQMAIEGTIAVFEAGARGIALRGRETEYLVEAAGDGRAQQIGAIRGILQRLAEDESVMERVRRRARVLLAKSDSPAG